MLTPQDDLIGHQLPTTFDHVDSSDPAWVERLWYAASPRPEGGIILDLGLGYHPNRNVMDAFAGVTIGTTQHNLRVSRQLRPDPLETRVGPLKFIVLEGLRRHRLVLTDNDSGISFDLELRALPARYFLKGGLYGGYKGWATGDDRGKLYQEHDRWDLRDPETRRLARTLSDHVIEVRDGDRVGHGVIEYGVSRGYPRYADVQAHPSM